MTGIDVSTRDVWTDPALEAAGATVFHGDSIEVLGADENGYPFVLGYGTRYLIPDNSIDSVVTDPPYGIAFMGNEWDQPGDYGSERRPTNGANPRGDADAALEAGRYDMSPKAMQNFERWCSEWAAEAYRVLKPGGHIVAFGGSRTWHRLTAGIEDAGFEIRDSIAWLYAQGFPKSRDVSQDIDRLDAAAERRARQLHFTAWMRTTGITSAAINQATATNMGGHYLTDGEQPIIPTADMFDLIRPLLTDPVPEDIEELVRARTVESQNYAAREVVGKHEKTAAANTWRAKYQEGASTTADAGNLTRAHTEEARKWEGWGTALKPAFEPIAVGRKPFKGTVAANLVTYGTGAINIDATRVGSEGGAGKFLAATGDTGSVSAFGDGLNGAKHRDESKRGRWPANIALDVRAAAELDRQAPDVGAAAPASGPTLTGATSAGVAFGARVGTDKPAEFYGDTGAASRVFPTFRFEPKAPQSERPKVDGVAHPTVKPLDLMMWLVRLVTPKGGTVLEPFAGSGTTVEACLREGFDCIAIEREAKYVPLIARRVHKDHAMSLFDDIDWGTPA